MTEILHPSYKFMLDLIYSSFPKNKKISLIDYGCGNGYLLDLLDKRKIKNYKGFEVNVDSTKVGQLKYNKQKNIQFKLFKKNQVPKLGPIGSADAIVLIGVLQYMSKQEIKDFLIEAKKVLKKNGLIFASCVVDHKIYTMMNFYGLFLPNYFLDRRELVTMVKKEGFSFELNREYGIFLGPLFSGFLVFFFDAVDKIFYQTKGILGPFGKTARKIATPILGLEYKIPIDYGYTLYLKARKI